KGRGSSLDGIPERLSALTRAQKVITRSRSHGVEEGAIGLSASPVAAEALGEEILTLVGRAAELGMDAEQAVRTALRGLEARVRLAEADAS
ncbi:MAG: nucleoside triphosphate pyrophosphohydrolase, partial [Propionicimonas sp.]